MLPKRIHYTRGRHRPTTIREQNKRKDHQPSVSIKSLEARSGTSDPAAQYYGSKNEEAASYTVWLDPRHRSAAFSGPPPDAVKVKRQRKEFYSQPKECLETS